MYEMIYGMHPYINSYMACTHVFNHVWRQHLVVGIPVLAADRLQHVGGECIILCSIQSMQLQLLGSGASGASLNHLHFDQAKGVDLRRVAGPIQCLYGWQVTMHMCKLWVRAYNVRCYLTSQRMYNGKGNAIGFSTCTKTHLSLARNGQVDIFQLVPQLPVIEQVESYFGWNFQMRCPFWLLLLHRSLRLLIMLLLLLLLRHNSSLCWRRWVVNTPVYVSF